MSEVLLWRIIGNDIEGRHEDGCMCKRLEHILTHEDEVPHCTKRFLINRVADPLKLRMIRDLLFKFGADFSEIPFQRDVYQTLGAEDKVAYLTNQAAAKNYCLDYAHENSFDYVIPADNSVWFFSQDWGFVADFVDPEYGLATPVNGEVTCIRVSRADKYVTIFDAITASDLVNTWETWELPNKMSLACPAEPQIMFRSSTDIRYSLTAPYGFVNLEMLTRLHIAGPWDRLPMVETSVIRTGIITSGTCIKLPSGNPELDLDGFKRYSLRSTFAKTLVDTVDSLLADKIS